MPQIKRVTRQFLMSPQVLKFYEPLKSQRCHQPSKIECLWSAHEILDYRNSVNILTQGKV